MILSICIPNYNRSKYLENCLNSIYIASKEIDNFEFEVCISDNHSEEKISEIIKKYQNKINIQFNQNPKHIGIGLNAIQSVKMAKGRFAWVIGNDDLLTPLALITLEKLLKKPGIDFFFINSFFLKLSYLEKFKHPIDTKKIQLSSLDKMSKLNSDKELNFWEIIDPKISWDFLIGIFFSIFNREKFLKEVENLDTEKLHDLRTWSNIENTCFHPMLLSMAFKNSKSFFCAKPLSLNLSGEREWKKLYEFVEIIRIPELLDFYRKQGMGFLRYYYCKNFALRNFSNFFAKILLGGEEKGRNYLRFKSHFLNNLIFPNTFLSIIYFIFRKIKKK